MKPKFTKEEKKLIGRRIRDARNAEKLTLEQLAEKCECSSKHIRGVVSETRKCRVTALFNVFQILF